MNTIRYYIMATLLMIAGIASGQTITRVSGTVQDDIDVLPGVNVVEIDASNRIVNAVVTDLNGNFVLPIKSQKNKIRFSFVGFQTQILPINKTVFKIMMKDANTLKEVVKVARRKMQTSGLAIPEREVSFSSQTISAKEFEGLGLTSVDEALQGRISGLDIVANSGNLGSGTSMRLRGVSSVSTITSSEPLIVVNGNVWNVDQSDFDPATASDEKFAQLLNVNPEDIEDIKVLKDAAATAIWGSQGANGVIEIKTKRGRKGAPHVSYSLRLTATHQPKGIDMLTGDQYTMMLKEAYFNPRQSVTAADIPEISYTSSDAEFSEWRQYDNNTEWVKEVCQTGLRQNHYVCVVGGDEKTEFRISGGYDHETGSVIKQMLNRLSTRMALDYYVNDRIKIMSNFSMTYTQNQKNYDNLLAAAYDKMPNLGIYQEDDFGRPTKEYYYMLQSASPALNDQKGICNPIASANLAKFDETTYDITPELELEYKLLGTDDSQHQLNYNGRVVMNIYNNYVDKDYPREMSTTDYFDTHSTHSASAKNLAFTTRHTLTFQPHFKNEDHYLLSMARFELVSGSSSNQVTDANRLPDGLSSPSAGGFIRGMTSGYNQWRSLYYTFSTHYSYKSRYSLMFSVRADATTKFGPNSRWGVFPALSGRWNIIDEPWMKWAREKVKMNMLSVRPGWGKVGTQPRQDFLYLIKYNSTGSYLGSTGMQPGGLKLTNFHWENRYTWNVGFDLAFFQDKLKMQIELYKQITKDMLMPSAPITTIYGYNSLEYRNVGDMENKGWEFNIQGERLLKKGKFSMDVNVTFANNHNVITSMDPLILETMNDEFDKLVNRGYDYNSDGVGDRGYQRVQINNPFGSIYGVRYKGVYQYKYETAVELAKQGKLQDAIDEGKTFPIAINAQGKYVCDDRGEPLRMMMNYKTGTTGAYPFEGGDAIYEDVNHDGNIDKLDVMYLGNSLPKLTGGFGFRLRYDRWALNCQFNYRVDYDIFNMARLDREAMTGNRNQSQAVNYRWRKEGDVTSIPRAMSTVNNDPNYNTLYSDRFVEDGTFLRMNYMQLSYSLPDKLLKKAHLNQLSFYASANNLFCLTRYTGVDPEITYGGFGVTTDNNITPRSKSYTFGVTIGF